MGLSFPLPWRMRCTALQYSGHRSLVLTIRRHCEARIAVVNRARPCGFDAVFHWVTVSPFMTPNSRSSIWVPAMPGRICRVTTFAKTSTDLMNSCKLWLTWCLSTIPQWGCVHKHWAHVAHEYHPCVLIEELVHHRDPLVHAELRRPCCPPLISH